MPTQLPPREPTKAQLLIQCGRYIAGIAILLVAVVLFKLRFVRAFRGLSQVRPGIPCHSAARRAHRRRLARIFLTRFVLYRLTVTGCRRSGQSGVPSFFWIQSPFAFLCEELHIRGSLPSVMFHRSRLWVEGNHAVGGGE
jgi:hypothetical protein